MRIQKKMSLFKKGCAIMTKFTAFLLLLTLLTLTINTRADDFVSDYIDYLELIGLSPEHIENMYGEPDEEVAHITEDGPYLAYHYRNAIISFALDDNDDWAVEGVSAYRPSCPIRMGDVYISMEVQYARQALEKNGYCLEMTDSEGCSFFTNEFAEGGFCLVMVWEEDGLVSEISGWQGKTAEQLFATGGGV